jgi:hypothetical protein
MFAPKSLRRLSPFQPKVLFAYLTSPIPFKRSYTFQATHGHFIHCTIKFGPKIKTSCTNPYFSSEVTVQLVNTVFLKRVPYPSPWRRRASRKIKIPQFPKFPGHWRHFFLHVIFYIISSLSVSAEHLLIGYVPIGEGSEKCFVERCSRFVGTWPCGFPFRPILHMKWPGIRPSPRQREWPATDLVIHGKTHRQISRIRATVGGCSLNKSTLISWLDTQ